MRGVISGGDPIDIPLVIRRLNYILNTPHELPSGQNWPCEQFNDMLAQQGSDGHISLVQRLDHFIVRQNIGGWSCSRPPISSPMPLAGTARLAFPGRQKTLNSTQ